MSANGILPAGPVCVVQSNDGSWKWENGFNTEGRDALLSGLEFVLEGGGFRSLVVQTAPGALRPEYFAPIRDVCDAHGVRLIAGALTTGYADNLYGSAGSPEWRPLSYPFAHRRKPGTTSVVDLDHWMLVRGLLGQDSWEWIERTARASVEITRGLHVWIDLEWLLHSTKQRPEWRDEHVAIVGQRLRGMCKRLCESGICPILYHPMPHETDSAAQRIAGPILETLRGVPVVYASAITYFDPELTRWKNTTPEAAARLFAPYATADRLLHGFISWTNGGTNAWTPERWRERAAEQGVLERSWYFFGAARTPLLTAQFGALKPLKVHDPLPAGEALVGQMAVG